MDRWCPWLFLGCPPGIPQGSSQVGTDVISAGLVTISERSCCTTLPIPRSVGSYSGKGATLHRAQALDLVAWSMLAVFVVSMVFTTILAVANGTFQQEPAGFVVLYLGFSAFMVVGALVVAHRPSNAIGWIFSAVGLLPSTGALAAEYATYAYLTGPGSLPGAILAAWYASWPWYPTLALALVFAPLLFPTGRLLSPRWRPAAWLAGAATAAFTLLAALHPDHDPSQTM